MRTLIIVILLQLLAFKVVAKTKISIYTGSKYEMEIVEDTEELAKARLSSILKASTWMKCTWNSVEEGSIVSRDGFTDTEYCHPMGFRIETMPVVSEDLLEAAIDAKVECGQNTIKFIAKNNVLKGLDNAQIKSMAMTYSTIFDLLNAGALDTALIDINAMTPDGTIVTYEDKTKIVNYINTCN